MLKTLRVSFLVPALVGAAMLPLAGCDKGGTGTGTGTATPAGGQAKAGGVGLVDFDRVFDSVQWKAELNRSLNATKETYRVALESFLRDVDNAVKDKKAQIARTARLTAPQIDDLNKNKDLDKLPLTSDQKQELFATLQNANYYVNQGNQYASGMFQRRQQELVTSYKQSLNPIIRRVAEANGMTMVVTPVDNVVYWKSDVDLTEKVVDEVQKSPPPHPVGEAQKLTFPKFESITAPPTPTTAPAALPTSQPVTPGRG
jgi:Skp family chaperone for outer membrane proteins